jgi:hypothetical protein
MDVKDFVKGYIDYALWLSRDRDGNPMDDSGLELSESAILELRKEAGDFFYAHLDQLEKAYQEAGCTTEDLGANLWLTQNGHGTGFWCMNISKDLSEYLSVAAHALGERILYEGDDGFIYTERG